MHAPWVTLCRVFKTGKVYNIVQVWLDYFICLVAFRFACFFFFAFSFCGCGISHHHGRAVKVLLFFLIYFLLIFLLCFYYLLFTCEHHVFIPRLGPTGRLLEPPSIYRAIYNNIITWTDFENCVWVACTSRTCPVSTVCVCVCVCVRVFV